MHFGISEGKGGLKHGSRPWLGMDIFWNCPIYKDIKTETCCFTMVRKETDLSLFKAFLAFFIIPVYNFL